MKSDTNFMFIRLCLTNKDKVVPVLNYHAMKTWVLDVQVKLYVLFNWTLDGVNGQLRASALMPPENVFDTYWTVWTPEEVWTLWRRQKFLQLPGVKFRSSTIGSQSTDSKQHWIHSTSSGLKHNTRLGWGTYMGARSLSKRKYLDSISMFFWVVTPWGLLRLIPPFRRNIQYPTSWIWRHCVSSKWWYLLASPFNFTNQKNNIDIFTAITISDLTS
jgi:hypothetical protein